MIYDIRSQLFQRFLVSCATMKKSELLARLIPDNGAGAGAGANPQKPVGPSGSV